MIVDYYVQDISFIHLTTISYSVISRACVMYGANVREKAMLKADNPFRYWMENKPISCSTWNWAHGLYVVMIYQE